MTLFVMSIALGLGLLGLLGAFFLVLATRSAHQARGLGPAPGPAAGFTPARLALPLADFDFRPLGRSERDDAFEPARLLELPEAPEDVFKPVGPIQRVNGKHPVRRCRVCGRPKSEGLHDH